MRIDKSGHDTGLEEAVANLLADGFSMGDSNYLAIRSNCRTGSPPLHIGALPDSPRAATLLASSLGCVSLLAYLVPGVEQPVSPFAR